METLTIAIIVITLTIILFSSFSYSYVSPDTNAQIPIDLLNSTGKQRSNSVARQQSVSSNSNKKEEIGKVNPNAVTYALFNLPEKDEYMTTDLRNQIDALRTQYYYDNCQFIEKNKNDSTKVKFTDICAQPTVAQIMFDEYNFNIA
jgi:hypothetical protein